MKHGNVIVSLLLTGFALSAHAAPLNPAHISRTANWVLHVDMDTFKTTTLSGFVRQKSAEAGLESQMEQFKKMYSFHPVDDVHGVTIYGFDNDQDHAVALIHANFKENKLVSLLQSPQTIIYGPHTIYSWNNQADVKKNKREYGAVWGYNLIVMAGILESVQQALDVLDQTAENASTGSYLSGYLPEPGQFIYVRADQVYEIAKNDPDDVILKQVEQFLLTAGEVNGRFLCRVDIGVPSQDKLGEVEQLCRGLLAYGSMTTGQNFPELTPVLQAVRVQPSAGLLSLWMDFKSADLVDVLSKTARRATAKIDAKAAAKAKPVRPN